MSKDPAALLYIDKYLIATAEMSADCVGWYTKLILHQYDKGSLPNDIETLASLCNVKFSEFERFKQVFKQVLKQKFKENDEGRLEQDFAKDIIKKREGFVNKRKKSGKIGAIIKSLKAESKLKDEELKFYSSELSKLNLEDLEELKDKHLLTQKLKHLHKLYINIDKDINKDISIVKGIPSEDEFLKYALEKKPKVNTESVKLKRLAWIENEWKTSGNNPRKIANWKTTLLNTLPHIEEMKQNTTSDIQF